MLRKDYIDRYMEEFGKVLAGLLLLKRNRDWEKFEAEMAAVTQRFTGLEILNIENMNIEEFKNKLLLNTEVSLEQKHILASLLYEKIEQYSSLNEQNKEKDTALKSSLLYEFLQTNQTQNEFNLEVYYRLQLLRKMQESD